MIFPVEILFSILLTNKWLGAISKSNFSMKISSQILHLIFDKWYNTCYDKKRSKGGNMDFELIPVQFNKILQSPNYTVFILEAAEKRFAIYTSPHIGQNLQVHLADQVKPRPYTYDLMNSIFKGLDINLLQVVITDVQDTLYFARLYVEQETDGLRNILEIDARPSDCLTLALENEIPIFCTKEVLDKTISIEE